MSNEHWSIYLVILDKTEGEIARFGDVQQAWLNVSTDRGS